MDSTPSRLKMVGLLALCLFLVPLLGWGTGWFLESEYDNRFRELVVKKWQRLSSDEFDARKMDYVSFCKGRMASGEGAKDFEALCAVARQSG